MAAAGLREKKKQRTRQALHAAALDLFERRGYVGTTVQEIAAAANVSPRTLFRYFPTKQDLAFGSTDEDVRELLRLVAERPHDECALLALRNALLAFARLIDDDEHARRSRVIAATAELRLKSSALGAEWGWALAQELAGREGLESPDVQHEVAGDLAQRLLLRSVRLWRERGAVRGALAGIVEESFSAAEQLFEEAAAA